MSWRNFFSGRRGRKVSGAKRLQKRLRRRSAIETLETRWAMAAPDQWLPRGASAGGVLEEPVISPHNPNEAYMVTDMGQMFRTKDLGNSWDFYSFLDLRTSNKVSGVQFTSDPNVLFALDSGTGSTPVPTKSLDGGTTWSKAGSSTFSSNWNKTENAWRLFTDVNSSGRLIVGTQDEIFLSTDAGTTFNSIYTYTGTVNLQQRQGLHVAGAFWAGSTLYVGTNAGVLVSTNNGPLQPLKANGSPIGGIPTTEVLFSFSGAASGNTVRLWGVTVAPASLEVPMQPQQPHSSYRNVYSLDVGQANWSVKTAGMPAGTQVLVVRTATDDINTAYIAGATGAGNTTEYVGKWSAATGQWSTVFSVAKVGGNVSTGWVGPGSAIGTCSNVKGLAVAPHDATRVMLADCFAAYTTTNAGGSWSNSNVDPAEQHAPGTLIKATDAYSNTGINNAVAWSIAWSDAQHMFVGFDDITAQRSSDGGKTFGFDYKNLPEQVLQVLKHPDPALHRLLAAQGHALAPHDVLGLGDSRVDPFPGKLLYSDDDGATWQTLFDFGHPVSWVAVDPNNFQTIYASVVNSVSGGIFVSHDGGGSFTKLANQPTGTEGRPHTVQVLNDGTLVAAFTGHQRASDNKMTPSSGVFRMAPGTNTWVDVSDAAMHYWTKDLVIDPTDNFQQTWFAAVNTAISPVASAANYPSNKPGIYMTTNRGQSWTQVFTIDADSITVNPANPNEAYVTSNQNGLWYTSNLRAVDGQGKPAPTFTQLTSFPHLRPNRVFFNPFNANEVWIATNGAGLFVGNASLPTRTFDFSAANYSIAENAGSATITVTRSGDVQNAMSVDYTVTSGSALATPAGNADFVTPPLLPTGITGTLTFHPGQAAATISIPIIDDNTLEIPETVHLSLSGPLGGNRLGTQAMATLTILDNEPLPVVSVSDVTITEGDAGQTTAQVVVSLSAAVPIPVSVNFATSDGSATASSGDYVSTSGTIVIPANATSGTIAVAINGDLAVETNETLLVALSSPQFATLGNAQATITIQNDDVVIAPQPQVADVKIVYGTALNRRYSLQHDPSGRTVLPWVNAQAVEVVFGQDVAVDINDLRLTGSNVPNYRFASFQYDPLTFTARWNLAAALNVDRLVLSLDGDDASSDGNDGVHGVGASARSYLAADLTKSFSVLPGDANGDGQVDSNDMRLALFAARSILFADLDGDGKVGLSDSLIVARRFRTRLP